MNARAADSTANGLASSNLTRSQFMIWSGQQMHPGVPLYNMAFRFDLDGALDTARFASAWQSLLTRCDALRLVFEERDGVPVQRVLEQLHAPLQVVDLSTHADPQAAAADWIEAQSRLAFDLTRCCVDSALLKLGPERHTWYLNQHHLTMDAWSSTLLFRLMSDTYAALASHHPELATLPPYSDFVRYESSLRDNEALAAAKRHWDELVRDSDPQQIQLYGKPLRTHSCDSVRQRSEFGHDRSQALRELAMQAGMRSLSPELSQFNLLATLVFAYLWRISGDPVQIIGTPAHNRPNLAFRETVGLFIEFFPLRVEIAEDDSFRSLHAKVAQAMQAYLRNAMPGASSSASVRAFRAVLNYIPAQCGDFAGLPTRTTWLHAGSAEPDHALRIQVHDFNAGGNLQLDFDANSTLFPAATRERAPAHFLALADALLDDPDRQIATVAIATPQEQQFQLEQFNHQPPASGATHNVIELFRQQAMQRAGATALDDGSRTLSYAQLDQASDQLAGRLRELGVSEGSRVCIFLDRSIDFVQAVLAVLKAGAAFVPIESRTPAARIAYILEDTQACLVISRSGLRDKLPEAAPVFACDSDSADSPMPAAAPLTALPHTAYVIYTSGSTGTPKGVVVRHSALADYAQWARRSFSGLEHPAYPLYSSIAFDLTITSLFVPLIAGGTLVIYPEEEEATDLAILRVFGEDRVDVVKLTPGHLRLVADRNLHKGRISSLVLGGEDLKTALARRISDASGGRIHIINEYGPTECVVACMQHSYDPLRDRDGSVPIGVPADGCRIYLLDSGQNPVPLGVSGEIHIAGRLADGYLGRPEETAQRFVADPWMPGERMYRSGDLGRLREDGILEYLGRNDDQIKLRGVRIEPAEVEQAMLQHPAIDACVLDLAPARRALPAGDLRHCKHCGIASNHPDAEINSDGVCSLCNDFERYREHAASYFNDLPALRARFDQARARRSGDYDCLMLLSGGKDSTYALYQVAALGQRVLAVTLDNGFISDGAKANINRVVASLGIEHRYLRSDAMNEIFVDSLERHSNVCNGCFKALYTLAVHTALHEGIPLIVTGLSRGQFFETRLTPEQFNDNQFDVQAIDQAVLEARKAYHRLDDAVSRLLDVSMFADDRVFEQVEFVDFYRYCEVSLDHMYAFLAEHSPWVRPSDTGRSTNCLINDVGIYVHQLKEGFHNYALPYSWDVRLGHKQRDAALDELNDELNVSRVEEILDEIGFDKGTLRDSAGEQRLIAYFTASQTLDRRALRGFLAERLPTGMLPTAFVQLQDLPLTDNGKVDRAALPVEEIDRWQLKGTYRAPQTRLHKQLAAIWRSVLRKQGVGIDDNFFDLGGDSLRALQIVAQANEAGLPLSAKLVFQHQTIAELAEAMPADAPADQAASPTPQTSRGIESTELDKLAALLGKS